jgi:histidinol phosphatase-like PHP family hydrolase
MAKTPISGGGSPGLAAVRMCADCWVWTSARRYRAMGKRRVYGRTGHFDVIAITDHILMERDLLARVGRLASLGYRRYSVTEDRFGAYLDEIESEAIRAKRLYGMLVVPGAEITQNHIRSKKNSHIVGLNLRKWVSASAHSSTCGRRRIETICFQ